MAGGTVRRIVRTDTNCIVIIKLDLSSIVESFFEQSKGDDALKLAKSIRHTHSGLSRNAIQRKLNVMKET